MAFTDDERPKIEAEKIPVVGVSPGSETVFDWRRHLIENRGWQYIANKLDDESDRQDMAFFAQLFNGWQKEAILLIEFSYHKDYDYVTPLGVFTHIGTLARRLKHIFKKKQISASMTGDVLRVYIENEEIKDVHHVYECRFVELNQAGEEAHCEGWKTEKALLAEQSVAEGLDSDDNIEDERTYTVTVFREELVGLANSLLDVANDPELESACHYAHIQRTDGHGVAVTRHVDCLVYRLRRQNASGGDITAADSE